MNHENTFYRCKVTPWLAWREYNVGGQALIVVYQQQTSIYFILDGYQSEIWHQILINGTISHKDAHIFSELFHEKVLSSPEYCPDSLNISAIKRYNTLPPHICELIKKEGYIFDIHWDLTNICNARCIHCYNSHSHDGTRNTNKNELSYDEALKLVDDLFYLGVFRIVISGGEAMTKEYFFYLCNYIRSKHIALIIYTNGLLLTEDNVTKLSGIYPTAICISVYGPNSEIHERISLVNNSYEKVISGCKILKKHKIKTCFKNTLLKSNRDYWMETYTLGRTLSNNSMINVTIYPSMDDGSITSVALDMEDLYQLALQCDSPIDCRKKLKGVCNIYKENTNTPCYNDTNQLYIDPNGNVYPCIAAPYQIANVRHDCIRNLKRYIIGKRFTIDIDKMTMEERLDNWRTLQILDLKECGKYDYCKFCIDVCPGDAFVMRGDYLLAPHNHCIIAQARHKAWLNINN